MGHAAAHLVRATGAPSITLSVTSASGGGAELVAVLYQGQSNLDGSPIWAFNDIAINNAGGGYAVGDQVVFTLNNGTALYYGYGTHVPFVVKTVGSGGAIVAFELDTNDKDIIDYYFAEYVGPANGPIESLALDYPGAYYLPGQTTVEVATVTVTVNQRGVAGASGAVITPTINTNQQSPTFGQIVSLAITNGGTGYLAWKWVEICCAPFWNGKTVVLKRPARSGFGPLKPCLYSHSFTNKGCTATVEVEYSQSSVRVMVNDPAGYTPTGEFPAFASAGCGAQAFATPRSGESCVQFPFEVTTAQGITFNVSEGGTYVPRPTTGANLPHTCCPAGGSTPLEIEARLHLPRDINTGEDPDPPFITVIMPAGFAGPAGVNCTPSYGVQSLGLYVAVNHCDDYLEPGCQNCPRGCETRAGIVLADYIRFPTCHWFSKSCQNCAAPPMCKPASGMYVINRRDPRVGYAPDWFGGCDDSSGADSPNWTPGDHNFYRLEIP